MLKRFTVFYLSIAWLIFLFSSCGSLNQNRMFRTKGQIISDTLLDAVSRAEKNYVIRKDDYLELHVYTNKGERLIDPNQEMVKQLGGGQVTNPTQANVPRYLVETTGEVKLPLVGRMKVEGTTLRQLDSLLQVRYSEYYEDAFVLSRVVNKRVFVLGNTGGNVATAGRVIPLENENMTVIEVLTIAGGLDQLAKSYNIRLIRGDLKNPNVYIIDLSTIEGVRQSQLHVQPNDIIYVERQRRVISQILTEVGPVVMLLNTVLLIFLASRSRL